MEEINNDRMLSLLIIIRLATNDFDQELNNIQIEEEEENIMEINLIFEEIINSIQEHSVENFINRSISTGTNIDAYNGLSSKFSYFIRGAIIPENSNDEQNLDNINKELIELERIDKNNIPEIINIFANIINSISSLSIEARNDMLQAFIGQSTLEEKMNEVFPQIGTIMLYSATVKNNKTLFSEKDIKILSEITKDIKLLGKKEYIGKLTKDMIVNNLHNSLFLATPYLQEIFLGIVKNNKQFFENIKKETGISFNETINKYELPIKGRKVI